MLLTIGICDDEPAELSHLSDLAKTWAEKKGHRAEINTFPSAESFLFEYGFVGSMPDILLLDVEMGHMNGVELARRIRSEGYSGSIVFITGYPDFMAEGFDVSALHYLLKPVENEKLFSVLDRAALGRLNKPRSILFSAEGESVSLTADKIYYAESRGHYMHVFTTLGEYRPRMTVSAAEELFGSGFVRLGRAYVVNLEHVLRIGKTLLTLSDGTELPVPRGMQSELNARLLKYTRER